MTKLFLVTDKKLQIAKRKKLFGIFNYPDTIFLGPPPGPGNDFENIQLSTITDKKLLNLIDSKSKVFENEQAAQTCAISGEEFELGRWDDMFCATITKVSVIFEIEMVADILIQVSNHIHLSSIEHIKCAKFYHLESSEVVYHTQILNSEHVLRFIEKKNLLLNFESQKKLLKIESVSDAQSDPDCEYHPCYSNNSKEKNIF